MDSNSEIKFADGGVMPAERVIGLDDDRVIECRNCHWQGRQTDFVPRNDEVDLPVDERPRPDACPGCGSANCYEDPNLLLVLELNWTRE